MVEKRFDGNFLQHFFKTVETVCFSQDFTLLITEDEFTESQVIMEKRADMSMQGWTVFIDKWCRYGCSLGCIFRFGAGQQQRDVKSILFYVF